jgi:hypothetical protein
MPYTFNDYKNKKENNAYRIFYSKNMDARGHLQFIAIPEV